MNPHQFLRSTTQDYNSSKPLSSKDSYLAALNEAKNFESSQSSYAVATKSTSSNSNNNNSNIEEILRCFICFNKVKNAQLCPNCSKLCCAVCIKKWLIEQKPQCPHCRCSLRVSQLVNCRFINDLHSFLETKREEEIEQCAKHKEKLSYYCKTCQEAICANCAMFEADHKGHEFEHINNVYESHVELIKVESQGIQQKLKDLTSNLTNLELTIDKLKKAKDEKVAEITLILEQMQQRLDQELKNKLLSLIQQRSSLGDEIEFLESMQNELNRHLTQSAKSELINKSGDLVKMLKEINAKPMNKYNNKAVSLDFTSEVVPQFDSGFFYLKSFSKIRKTQEVVYSDVLQSNGLQWRLKVYPNGNGVAKNAYISVFLEMLKGLHESSKYEYRVEMVNQKNPSVVVLREFASEFENGECWGYNRFFKIDLLEREGYLGDKDTIILKYYVRAPTYFQQCQDQKRYIEQLERSKRDSNATISELKEKLKHDSKSQKKATHSKAAASDIESERKMNDLAPSIELENKTSEVKRENLALEHKCSTNKKDSSLNRTNKEAVTEADELRLDDVSTQKKDDAVALKQSLTQNLSSKMDLEELKVALDDEHPSKSSDGEASSEDSGYDELFANGNELPGHLEGKPHYQEDSSEKMPNKIEDLFGRSQSLPISHMIDGETQSEDFSQNDEEISDDNEQVPTDDIYEENKEIESEEGDIQQDEDVDDELGTLAAINTVLKLNAADLDKICEKKERDSSSQILASHDIDQIEIDKFLNYNFDREVPSQRTEVMKNLLPNFDAAKLDNKRNKKAATDEFASSMQQFSEKLMKKIESIKTVNQKYKKTETEDKRKPLSQSSKLNIMDTMASEHGQHHSREMTSKAASHIRNDHEDENDYQH